MDDEAEIDEDAILAEQDYPPRVDLADVVRATEQVVENDSAFQWEIGTLVDLDSFKWIPSAASDNGAALLYVSLNGVTPRFVAQRLRKASELGKQVVLAVTLAALYVPEFCRLLSEIEAHVYVLDDRREERRFTRRHFMAAIADLSVAVRTEVRAYAGLQIWDRLAQGPNNERGRRLESLLAFLFSQARDFKVVERNFRAATDEVDVVLQVDNFSDRAWQIPGVPFILVEAKNTIDKTDQKAVSGFVGKLRSKRDTTRIGFLCSVHGFTKDARMQTLKYAESTTVPVLLDGADIRAAIESVDLDEFLESALRRAALN